MSSKQFDELVEEATKFQPSKEWPPVLAATEKTIFTGRLTLDAWLKKNVCFSAGFIILSIFAAPLIGVSMTQNTALLLGAMTLFGVALVFTMYCRQEWLITDRAIYVKGRTPTLLSSLKRIQGFGSTVRFTGRFGLSQNLVGVANAAQVRQELTGRKK